MPTRFAHWTVRRLELGRTTVTHSAARVTLEVMDGGGFVVSFGVWRIEGRTVTVVEAAEA